MAHFQVHEDHLNIENVRPKLIKKGEYVERKNRIALQPLTTFQQNHVHPYKREKENIGLKKVSEKEETKLPHPCNDLIKLKPIFKRTNVLSRINAGDSIEYSDDIWIYLNEFEKTTQFIKPNYMCKQSHINSDMRRVLVDWLVTVADEYKMNENTVHLSINYLDRFLSNISVIREKFQLVGATAMMLAGKIEEIFPPDLKEWAYLTDETFTVRQFIKMEQLMLKILNFDMNPPTILDFLKHLCLKHKIDSKTMYLAMYLSELMLLEGDEYFEYFPSKLAASSVVLARHTLYKAEPWTRKMEETAGYTLKQLSPIVQRQHKTFKSSPFKEEQAIQKKYSSEKYQKVALLKPRILRLDEEE